MDNQFEIAVAPVKTWAGKRTGFYRAEIRQVGGIADMSADGETAKEAKTALVNALGELANHTFTRSYTFTKAGPVLVLYYNGNWCYDIISPDRNWPSSCIMGKSSYLDALASVRGHAEQCFGGVLKQMG